MFDLTQYYQILPKITKNFPKWLFPLSIVLKYFPQMKIHYRHASEVIQVQFHTTNITIRQGTHFFGFAEHIRSDVCTTKVMFLRMYTAICIQAPPPSWASLHTPTPGPTHLGHHRARSWAPCPPPNPWCHPSRSSQSAELSSLCCAAASC